MAIPLTEEAYQRTMAFVMEGRSRRRNDERRASEAEQANAAGSERHKGDA